ncbi:MAG: hypothetical protein HYZ75_04545 [Elusimicrobia bacterium]|nr:hypothetical protein [Elusimicrobiota bacterium]
MSVRDGRWLSPRHPAREAFERDFPKVDLEALAVYCPGCKAVVKLSRRSLNARTAGWCMACSRGVAA